MAIAEPPPADLVLDADLDRIADARAWVREHAAAAGFSGRELGELELVVTEAVSNVIRHGYQHDSAAVVELHADVDDTALVLLIVDHGPAFDPTSGEPADLAEPREGGYGLYLIKTVMDNVSWRQRDDGANELRLVRFSRQGS